MESIVEILRVQALQLLNIIPALIKAVVILVVGIVLAKVLRNVIRRALEAIRVDQLVDRLMQIDFFRDNNISLIPSRVVSSAVYYFVLIVFTMAAVEALGMQIISDLLTDFIEYIPSGVTAFLILIFGIFLADAIKRIVLGACRSLGIAAGNLIANVVFYFILLNIVLIALRQAKLQTDFMEDNISIILGGLAGAFAIGYGLASRHVMGNLLSSFYNRDRIRVGDEISFQGQRGEVIQVSHVSIVLRGEDSEFIVPFSKLSSEGVQIHTRRESGPALPPNLG